ncbi:MAG: hypothetical protein HOH33_10615 [Verrucomicrobia bacterium]|nr:hypothetical protein [Verrucomicrobiota bacterium]
MTSIRNEFNHPEVERSFLGLIHTGWGYPYVVMLIDFRYHKLVQQSGSLHCRVDILKDAFQLKSVSDFLL